MQTRGQKVNSEIADLIRARNSLLWIVSREEKRVESALTDIATSTKFTIRFWDCFSGMTKYNEQGKLVVDTSSGSPGNNTDPSVLLNSIQNSKERTIYVLRDFPKLMDPIVMRGVRSLARQLQSRPATEAAVMVILTPASEIPPELSGHTTVIEYPIPDRQEIAKILDEVMSALPDIKKEQIMSSFSLTVRENAINASVGLSADEAANCFARSLVSLQKIDPHTIASEKKRVIAREKVLTWIDPDPRGLSAIGGLDLAKVWAVNRKVAFTEKAREYGLPAPKGVLLVGIAGTGKSLLAKCLSTAWEMPLLRLDLGALKSKYVGDSEANIRKALATAETVAPCVVWLDEIEKALAGSTGAQGDGGVSADALGAILSWMQDRQGSVFVVATANDVRSLPPELLRKGRFDEIFWVDLPTAKERKEILLATLNQFKQPNNLDFSAVIEKCKDFTGAEIAALVPEAMFSAFADGERKVQVDDLLKAATTVVPLSRTAAEKIQDLRNWAKDKARPASSPDEVVGMGQDRSLDFA